MAEIRAAEDKYVTMVPRFELPKDFDKPKPDIAQPPAAPAAKPVEATPPADGGKEAKTPDSETPPESEATPETPPETEDAEKRRLNAQRRIADRARRTAAESQARAEAAEKELAEIRAKHAPQPPSAEPKMEDYTDIKEFAKDYAKFETAKALKEHEEKQVQARIEQGRSQLNAQWQKKVEAGEEKYEDWQEVVGDVKAFNEKGEPIPWAIAMYEEDNAHDIAYYLGTHLNEVKKIAAMHPFAQAKEIGKLSLKVAELKPAPQKPSKAPAPITPVSGNTSISEPDLTKPMDPGDYMKIGAKMFRGR